MIEIIHMTKGERLSIEEIVRVAVNAALKVNTANCKLSVSPDGPRHEFDIFQLGEIIGGVSTSPYLTSEGKPNTGGRDRAAAELLWLSLWQGPEKRIHVLTCSRMASWLFKRFNGAKFPFAITIFWYCHEKSLLKEIGVLSE